MEYRPAGQAARPVTATAHRQFPLLVSYQGEVPQHYVENNHEAIIDPETFEMVQREPARRTKGMNRHSGVQLTFTYKNGSTFEG